MAKLTFYYGAMNSGKSISLMKDAHNLEEKGYKVLVIKASIDTKGGNKLVSRIGIERNVDIILNKNTSILNEYSGFLKDISLILADEAQFLTKKQIEELWKISKILDIPVNCYGLKTNFKSEFFEGSKRLFELSDEVEELKTLCDCKRKARYNARKVNGKYVLEGQEVVIDGSTSEAKYVPLCAYCYMKYVLGINIEEEKNKILTKK